MTMICSYLRMAMFNTIYVMLIVLIVAALFHLPGKTRN